MKFFIKFITLGFATSLAFFKVSVADDRPNILWIVSEDNGARWLGCYGNPAKPTPTLDKLAAEGFRYERCYSSIPVCAPQRFTWLTGICVKVACGDNEGIETPTHQRFYTTSSRNPCNIDHLHTVCGQRFESDCVINVRSEKSQPGFKVAC